MGIIILGQLGQWSFTALKAPNASAEPSTPISLVVFLMLQMRGVQMVAATVSCLCDLGVVGACMADFDDKVVSNWCVQSKFLCAGHVRTRTRHSAFGAESLTILEANAVYKI
jgi:hypothetical protein